MMPSSRSTSTVAVVLMALVAALLSGVDAFSSTSVRSSTTTTITTRSFQTAPLNVFGKKKKEEEDLSFIETRDMTREEMLELNKKNEDIMNMELQAMTWFSLILSLPILYLCWVAFFSD